MSTTTPQLTTKIGPAHVIYISITEPTKANGWVERSDYPDFPIIGTREGRTWHLYAGTADEYRSQGSSLVIALKRLAKAVKVTGTAAVFVDRTMTETVYDLTTGEIVIAPKESAPVKAPTFSLPFEPSYNTDDDGTSIRNGNGEVMGWTYRLGESSSWVPALPDNNTLGTVESDAAAQHAILMHYATPVEDVLADWERELIATPQESAPKRVPNSVYAIKSLTGDVLSYVLSYSIEDATAVAPYQGYKASEIRVEHAPDMTEDDVIPMLREKAHEMRAANRAKREALKATREAKKSANRTTAENVRVIPLTVGEFLAIEDTHKESAPVDRAERYNIFVDQNHRNVAILDIDGAKNVLAIADFLDDQGFKVSYDMPRSDVQAARADMPIAYLGNVISATRSQFTIPVYPTSCKSTASDLDWNATMGQFMWKDSYVDMTPVVTRVLRFPEIDEFGAHWSVTVQYSRKGYEAVYGVHPDGTVELYMS